MAKLINFELLAAVEVLSEEISYLKAAQRLNTTSSLLKRRIAALEGQLEFKIFEPHGKEVQVTSEGRAFIDASRTFLSEVKKLKSR